MARSSGVVFENFEIRSVLVVLGCFWRLGFCVVLKDGEDVWHPRTLRPKLPGQERTELQHHPLRYKRFRDLREKRLAKLDRREGVSEPTSKCNRKYPHRTLSAEHAFSNWRLVTSRVSDVNLPAKIAAKHETSF